jgi:hypothetical protein
MRLKVNPTKSPSSRRPSASCGPRLRMANGHRQKSGRPPKPKAFRGGRCAGYPRTGKLASGRTDSPVGFGGSHEQEVQIPYFDFALLALLRRIQRSANRGEKKCKSLSKLLFFKQECKKRKSWCQRARVRARTQPEQEKKRGNDENDCPGISRAISLLELKARELRMQPRPRRGD